MNLKETLFIQSKTFVNNRLQTVEAIIASNKKALHSETKSSAGDKHETGRAMLQLEMEKASQQLAGIAIMKQTLAKVDVSKQSETVCLGSVVKTSIANYFIAVSAGQLNALNETYFAVSTASPIGKLLLGKKVSDKIVFNGKTIEILKIV
jgi:transcription elongation GreA/GreB family factor